MPRIKQTSWNAPSSERNNVRGDTATVVVSNEPTQEEIQNRAYEIYLERNGQAGDPIQDWLQAEAELRAARRGH